MSVNVDNGQQQSAEIYRVSQKSSPLRLSTIFSLGRSLFARLAVDMKFPIHIHIHIHIFLRGYPWIYDISISIDAYPVYM